MKYVYFNVIDSTQTKTTYILDKVFVPNAQSLNITVSDCNVFDVVYKYILKLLYNPLKDIAQIIEMCQICDRIGCKYPDIDITHTPAVFNRIMKLKNTSMRKALLVGYFNNSKHTLYHKNVFNYKYGYVTETSFNNSNMRLSEAISQYCALYQYNPQIYIKTIHGDENSFSYDELYLNDVYAGKLFGDNIDIRHMVDKIMIKDLSE